MPDDEPLQHWPPLATHSRLIGAARSSAVANSAIANIRHRSGLNSAGRHRANVVALRDWRCAAFAALCQFAGSRGWPQQADNGAVFSLVRPSAGALGDLVLGQAACDLTYREVGASAGTMPLGYRHDRWEIDLGAFDEDAFRRLAAALQNWQPQRGAGFTIAPGGPVAAGLTFALVVPLPVGYVTGTGRVIYVTDQPEDYGFAYGTLPAHPEQGEEAFHVARHGGRLVFSVTAFSRPRHPAARLAGPLTRALQFRANRSYLRAMRRAAALEPR